MKEELIKFLEYCEKLGISPISKTQEKLVDGYLAQLKAEAEKEVSACNDFHSDPFVNEYKCLNCGKMLSEHRDNLIKKG